MMLRRPEARLLFGSAEIHAPEETRFFHNSQGWHPFSFVVLSEGMTFGHPEPETTEVPSALLDGVIVTTTRHGNRQIECMVQVQSKTGEGLAQGEQALMREVNKARGVLQRNSFTTYPAQPFGEPTVYIVLEADLPLEYDDNDEMLCRRTFRLILTCMPFGRSVDEVVTPAVGTGETVEPAVLVTAPVSTAGWSATVAGLARTPAMGPGGVTVTAPILRTQLLTNPLFMAAGASMPGWAMRADTIAQPLSGGKVAIAPKLWWSPSPFPIISGSFQFFSSYMPVSAGLSYTASGHFSVSRTGITAGTVIKIFWYNATSGSPIGTTTSTAMGADPNGFHSVTGTPPAGATRARWGVEGMALARVRPDLIVRSALFERESTRQPAFSGDTPAADGAGYRWTGTPGYSTSVMVPAGVSRLVRSGLSEDFTGTPFAHVTFSSSDPNATITAAADGVDAPLVAVAAVGGAYRAVFDLGEATVVTSLAFNLVGSTAAAPASFAVARIERSAAASPYVSTARQLFRSLQVHGTARAPASLALGHESDGLGQTLIYTCAEDGSGYQPPLMQYRVSGAPRVVDASTKSGAYSQMTAATTEVFEIPTRQVPTGLYEILAAVRRTGTDGRSINFTASTRMDDSIDRAMTAGFRHVPPVEFDPLGGWSIVSVTQVSLPRLATDGAGKVRITLRPGADLDLDDVWLCNLTTGQITLVSAGANRRLWVDSPTLDRPRPTIWLGDAEDRSDARHATSDEIRAWGVHQFLPGAVNAFSACDAVNAALSLRQHKWFMHNVAAHQDDEDAA